MDPLHWVRRRERQCARQHLIKHDAERIEITARVDRAIHPPGLFRRHIGERAGDGLGRCDDLSFARQPRRDAEAGEPRRAIGAVHQDIAGFQVLMDQTGLVGFAQSGRDADREAQEDADLHRLAQQACERFAAGVLEYQHGAAVFSHELQRPRRPGAIELVPELIFVRKPFECQRRWAIRGEEDRQDTLALAFGPRPRPAEQNAFAVSP
jgi:hypothetical protein